MVNEEDTEELRDEGDDGRDRLVLQGIIAGNTHLSVDSDRIVLYGRHSRHLDRGLKRAAEEETAERRPVGKKLNIGPCLVFVLESELVLDLLELGLYPCVVFVTMSVQPGKIA